MTLVPLNCRRDASAIKASAAGDAWRWSMLREPTLMVALNPAVIGQAFICAINPLHRRQKSGFYREGRQPYLRCVESGYAYNNNSSSGSRSLARKSLGSTMKIFGFQLIYGDFLARSVRGISCAPPTSLSMTDK
ncbi:hypothetical protein [Pseudomonas fluorescens]|uniref:hypothetical protein n=1 Tax=Pseudomonas fluorescens TaxID=294 RepID=UPI001241CE3D|nr:hypothetical protein [Pseudomonas fluorescens]